MKDRLIGILQAILGLRQYLFILSALKISLYRFRKDRDGRAFLKFVSLIPADGVVLDIGANIGYTTAVLARSVRHVHAFEPMPANYETLERISAFFRLRNVTTYPWALGNEDGQIDLVMPVRHSRRMQAYSSVVTDGETGSDGDRASVACKRLDDLAHLRSEQVAAIKIDVEGHEFHVLQGAKDLIDHHRPLILAELADEANRRDSLGLMEAIGYKTMVLDGEELTDYTGQHAVNFFLLPRPRPAG